MLQSHPCAPLGVRPMVAAKANHRSRVLSARTSPSAADRVEHREHGMDLGVLLK
jgi:hypothetical protein